VASPPVRRDACDLFFDPFHALYTAGLCDRIAPQESEKSPLPRPAPAARTDRAGYNASFAYPREGLDTSWGASPPARIEFAKRAVRIDLGAREVLFADDSSAGYDRLLSTLPLDQTLAMASLRVEAAQDPHTSVLVLNIDALRGPACPDHHWLYLPGSRSGFHRIGFYSNVDPGFLPAEHRETCTRVSLYVERAFAAGARPAEAEERRYAASVVAELQDWGFIAEPEVVDTSWVETAYTWSWPGSRWRELALEALERRGIELAGRYARWRFQGIADSIRDGLRAGARLREPD
jgi:hypothetical protein